MTKVGLPKVHKGKIRFLSLEEEEGLCEKIEPGYAPWIRFAILTGLRREEQFSLRWADVDLEHGVLTILHTKAGGSRHSRLNAEAQTLLGSLESWQRSVWVFPSHNPATHYDSDNFYRRVYLPAVQKVGLEGVTWHTLRHTFASRLAMAGATEQDIAACLGHSSTALVKRYVHLSSSHLQRVMEKVSAFGKQAGNELQEGRISSPTVTGTGNEGKLEPLPSSQAVGKIGAGDGI